jgi:hypothetical protein
MASVQANPPRAKEQSNLRRSSGFKRHQTPVSRDALRHILDPDPRAHAPVPLDEWANPHLERTDGSGLPMFENLGQKHHLSGVRKQFGDGGKLL